MGIGRPLRHLDQNEIRRLYEHERLTIHEVAVAMQTSVTTLYREWPADLPKRIPGRVARPLDRQRASVQIRANMVPNVVVSRLLTVLDPEDAVDVAKGINEELDRRYPHARAM
jgi:hypothetical protein